jgi:hypothetical protein
MACRPWSPTLVVVQYEWQVCKLQCEGAATDKRRRKKKRKGKTAVEQNEANKEQDSTADII